MNKRLISALLFAVLIFSLITPSTALSGRTNSGETLGTITQCTVDKKFSTITVAGSIKHSVLVDNSNAQIAVYRFDPWKNVNALIKTAVPLSSSQISIRFEFDLPCTTVAQRLSLYAVALVSEDGSVSLISKPRYADLSSDDTDNINFKGVLSSDIAGTVASHAGTAIVDVVLDKLNNGNKSGYIFNADGDIFYFDRSEINALDKKIMSYTASGCDIFLRFLISPMASNLPFCSNEGNYIANKCVTVEDSESLRALYAYTYFLASRYDGDDLGSINGIILGRGADSLELYNYADVSSDAYAETYARSLAVVALSALEAQGNGSLSFVVPVGDLLDEGGGAYCKNLLDSVASYLLSHSNLTFTVMCESRHNPYKITDDLFDSGSEDGDETENTDISSFEASDVYTNEAQDNAQGNLLESDTADGLFTDNSTIDSYTGQASPDDTSQNETTPPSSEDKIPVINKNSDGYFCTDNIDTFISMFNRLKKQYVSVNDGFAWCWYPSSDTLENALGICYAYNYLKLASVSADFYTVAFEGEASGRFIGISRLFKYIDTEKGANETSYAKSVFGISEWSEIIKGYDSNTGVYSNLIEKSLLTDTDEYTGSMIYLDYTSSAVIGDWFAGLYCNGIYSENGEHGGCIKANFDLQSAGFDYADMGYIFDSPEPLLLGDALEFEVRCGESDGSLYEISVYVYSDNSVVVSKSVIEGGVKTALGVDVTEFDSSVGVDSMRIGLKRITGSGDCDLELYKIKLKSISLDDNKLHDSFKSVRDLLRTDDSEANAVGAEMIFLSVISLTVIGLLFMITAYGSDKRRRDEIKKNK